MNVEIVTVAAQFLFWEYLFPIFGIDSLQWVHSTYPVQIEMFLDHDPLVHAMLDLDVLGHILQDKPVHFPYSFTVGKNSFVMLTPITLATLQGKSHLCIPFLGIAGPQSQFPHSCVCERFYIFPGSVHILSWKYMNLSQIYECRNWETGHYHCVLEITASFLGIHKWEPDIYIGFSPALHLQCTLLSLIYRRLELLMFWFFFIVKLERGWNIVSEETRA